MRLATTSSRKKPCQRTLSRLNRSSRLNSPLKIERRIVAPRDESQDTLEVTTLMLVLTSGATIDISTWNIRTMWETGRNSKKQRKCQDTTWKFFESVKPGGDVGGG